MKKLSYEVSGSPLKFEKLLFSMRLSVYVLCTVGSTLVVQWVEKFPVQDNRNLVGGHQLKHRTIATLPWRRWRSRSKSHSDSQRLRIDDWFAARALPPTSIVRQIRKHCCFSNCKSQTVCLQLALRVVVVVVVGVNVVFAAPSQTRM